MDFDSLYYPHLLRPLNLLLQPSKFSNRLDLAQEMAAQQPAAKVFYGPLCVGIAQTLVWPKMTRHSMLSLYSSVVEFCPISVARAHWSRLSIAGQASANHSILTLYYSIQLYISGYQLYIVLLVFEVERIEGRHWLKASCLRLFTSTFVLSDGFLDLPKILNAPNAMTLGRTQTVWLKLVVNRFI